MHWLKYLLGGEEASSSMLDHVAIMRADWNRAREEADNLTAVYMSPPIPVLEIAEGLGLDIRVVEFGEHSKTVSGFIDLAERKIWVNSADGFNRKLFTIAHEIGHYILHRDRILDNPDEYQVLARETGIKTTPMEQEANFFAANLLVPGHLLKTVRSYGAATLASIFCVSREMMENRLKNVR